MQKAIFLLLIFLAACAAPEVATEPEVKAQEVEEPEPTPERIIEERTLVQCWDNSTAESVEGCPPQPEPEQPPQVPIGKQLLAEAKSKFDSIAYVMEDQMVIQKGDKVRHYFFNVELLPDRTPVTDVYVDLDKKTAVAYCNIERESDLLDDAFDYERSRCKDYVNEEIEVEFAEWVPKGPVEYLEEFAEREPMLVEDNLQTISIGGNSKSIQPSLHYDVNGKRVILRIDRRYNVPVRIEKEGEDTVDFRETNFDVMVLEGRQFKIDDSWVTYEPVSEYWEQ